MREGSALLQGLASCGHCGWRLKTHYSGRNTTPGYHCAGKTIVEGRGCYCLNVGGVQIDEAIAKTFLAALVVRIKRLIPPVLGQVVEMTGGVGDSSV